MITLWDILIVAGILGFASWGWREGLEASAVAALELLACLAVAVTFHETLAGFLYVGAELLVGDWASQAWSIALAFGLLAWGTFAGVRFGLHARGESADDEEAEIDPLADRLGGVIAGALGGALVIGGGLVTLSMIPPLAGLKPADALLLDVGKTVLRTAGAFSGGDSEGRSLPVWGEPPSRRTVLSARLTSEPWFDADDDGTCTEADRYRDVDDNGTFTKDLFFEDRDGDGLRRIGLIDKYVVGRWDGMLMSEDRPRPKPETPATTGPKPPRSPGRPAKPTQPEKPPGRQPAKPKQPGKQEPDKPEPAGVEDSPPPTERRPEDDF